ncbi:MAG: M48 family metalloprotease, partial [Deltaproteobacteria bacterium]|nr:M48 family metalloprotease [Deltaproteobacteria bacterium]
MLEIPQKGSRVTRLSFVGPRTFNLGDIKRLGEFEFLNPLHPVYEELNKMIQQLKPTKPVRILVAKSPSPDKEEFFGLACTKTGTVVIEENFLRRAKSREEIFALLAHEVNHIESGSDQIDLISVRAEELASDLQSVTRLDESGINPIGALQLAERLCELTSSSETHLISPDVEHGSPYFRRHFVAETYRWTPLRNLSNDTQPNNVAELLSFETEKIDPRQLALEDFFLFLRTLRNDYTKEELILILEEKLTEYLNDYSSCGFEPIDQREVANFLYNFLVSKFKIPRNLVDLYDPLAKTTDINVSLEVMRCFVFTPIGEMLGFMTDEICSLNLFRMFCDSIAKMPFDERMEFIQSNEFKEILDRLRQRFDFNEYNYLLNSILIGRTVLIEILQQLEDQVLLLFLTGVDNPSALNHSPEQLFELSVSTTNQRILKDIFRGSKISHLERYRDEKNYQHLDATGDNRDDIEAEANDPRVTIHKNKVYIDIEKLALKSESASFNSSEIDEKEYSIGSLEEIVKSFKQLIDYPEQISKVEKIFQKVVNSLGTNIFDYSILTLNYGFLALPLRYRQILRALRFETKNIQKWQIEFQKTVCVEDIQELRDRGYEVFYFDNRRDNILGIKDSDIMTRQEKAEHLRLLNSKAQELEELINLFESKITNISQSFDRLDQVFSRFISQNLSADRSIAERLMMHQLLMSNPRLNLMFKLTLKGRYAFRTSEPKVAPLHKSVIRMYNYMIETALCFESSEQIKELVDVCKSRSEDSGFKQVFYKELIEKLSRLLFPGTKLSDFITLSFLQANRITFENNQTFYGLQPFEFFKSSGYEILRFIPLPFFLKSLKAKKDRIRTVDKDYGLPLPVNPFLLLQNVNFVDAITSWLTLLDFSGFPRFSILEYLDLFVSTYYWLLTTDFAQTNNDYALFIQQITHTSEINQSLEEVFGISPHENASLSLGSETKQNSGLRRKYFVCLGRIWRRNWIIRACLRSIQQNNHNDVDDLLRSLLAVLSRWPWVSSLIVKESVSDQYNDIFEKIADMLSNKRIEDLSDPAVKALLYLTLMDISNPNNMRQVSGILTLLVKRQKTFEKALETLLEFRFLPFAVLQEAFLALQTSFDIKPEDIEKLWGVAQSELETFQIGLTLLIAHILEQFLAFGIKTSDQKFNLARALISRSIKPTMIAEIIVREQLEQIPPELKTWIDKCTSLAYLLDRDPPRYEVKINPETGEEIVTVGGQGPRPWTSLDYWLKSQPTIQTQTFSVHFNLISRAGEAVNYWVLTALGLGEFKFLPATHPITRAVIKHEAESALDTAYQLLHRSQGVYNSPISRQRLLDAVLEDFLGHKDLPRELNSVLHGLALVLNEF